MLVDPANVADDHQVATTSLHTFMRLPVKQRSCVILKDVIGHSLEEVGEVIDSSVPAVKATLNRGRALLRELAQGPDDRPLPVLTEPQRSLLAAYVDRFNARDFDAIRNMLADEVRLDLVNKTRLNGKAEVSKYFGNYALLQDWLLVPGFVDRRPAILVCDPSDASRTPAYFVVLDWASGRLARITDFRHARYATDGAEILMLD